MRYAAFCLCFLFLVIYAVSMTWNHADATPPRAQWETKTVVVRVTPRNRDETTQAVREVATPKEVHRLTREGWRVIDVDWLLGGAMLYTMERAK